MENAEKERLWQITLTEEQMRVMAQALEDWHRFVCGECSMVYATSYIDSPAAMRLARKMLDTNVKSVIFPELAPDEAYSWDGGQPNEHLSRAAAISYLLYREARHQLALAAGVYDYKTLTCAEQGPMVEIRQLRTKTAKRNGQD